MLFSFKDHECSGKSTKAMSDAAKAAIARQERQNQNQGIAKYFQRQQVVNPPPRPNAAQIQGNLSEDEALGKTNKGPTCDGRNFLQNFGPKIHFPPSNFKFRCIFGIL